MSGISSQTMRSSTFWGNMSKTSMNIIDFLGQEPEHFMVLEVNAGHIPQKDFDWLGFVGQDRQEGVAPCHESNLIVYLSCGDPQVYLGNLFEVDREQTNLSDATWAILDAAAAADYRRVEFDSSGEIYPKLPLFENPQAAQPPPQLTIARDRYLVYFLPDRIKAWAAEKGTKPAGRIKCFHVNSGAYATWLEIYLRDRGLQPNELQFDNCRVYCLDEQGNELELLGSIYEPETPWFIPLDRYNPWLPWALDWMSADDIGQSVEITGNVLLAAIASQEWQLENQKRKIDS